MQGELREGPQLKSGRTKVPTTYCTRKSTNESQAVGTPISGLPVLVGWAPLLSSSCQTSGSLSFQGAPNLLGYLRHPSHGLPKERHLRGSKEAWHHGPGGPEVKITVLSDMCPR